MNVILIILLAIIAVAETGHTVLYLVDLIGNRKLLKQTNENQDNLVKLNQQSLDVSLSNANKIDLQNSFIHKLVNDVNTTIGDFDIRIKALEESSKPKKKSVKDKGKITVRNTVDTSKTRKKLNPDAEKLDEENGVKRVKNN